MFIYLFNILVSGQIKQLGTLEVELYQNREQIVTFDDNNMQFGFLKRIQTKSDKCKPQDYEFQLNKKFQIGIETKQLYLQSFNKLYINDGNQIQIIELQYEQQQVQQYKNNNLNQIYNYTMQNLNFSGQIIGLYQDHLYVYKEGYAYQIQNSDIVRFNNTLPKYNHSITTDKFVLLLDHYYIYQYDFNFTQYKIYTNNDYQLSNLTDVLIQESPYNDFYLINQKIVIRATFNQSTSTYQFKQFKTEQFDNISMTDNGYIYTYDSQFIIHNMNSTHYNADFQDLKSIDKYIILIQGQGVNQLIYRFRKELCKIYNKIAYPQYFNTEGITQTIITRPDIGYQQYLIVAGNELEIYQIKQRYAYLICKSMNDQSFKLEFQAEVEDCYIDGDILPCQLNGTIQFKHKKVYIEDPLDIESLFILSLIIFAVLTTIYLVVNSRVKVAQIKQDRLRRQIEINRIISKTEESQIPECD